MPRHLHGASRSCSSASVNGKVRPSSFFVVCGSRRTTRAGAEVAIIVLRTPGGLLESTRTIVSRIIAAGTPVVVYVAPGGARAASAGFIITIAADVAAMARTSARRSRSQPADSNRPTRR